MGSSAGQTQEANVGNTESRRMNLEKCLNKIAEYVPKNEAIKSKREELGKFKFDCLKFPEKVELDYVEDKKTGDEKTGYEIYHGFM
jgi:hypothetical protein